MAIANIATSTSGSITIGGSGNNRVVVAMVTGSHWDAGSFWTTATLNGVSGTSIRAQGTADNFKAQAFIWFDANLPASGSSYSVTLNGDAGNGRQITLFYATGVDQGGAVDAEGDDAGGSETITRSPGSGSGSVAFMCTSINMTSGSPTFSTNETAIYSNVGGFGQFHTYDDVDSSCTHAANNEFRAWVSFAIEAAAGGGGSGGGKLINGNLTNGLLVGSLAR